MFILVAFILIVGSIQSQARCDSLLQAASSDSGFSFISGADTAKHISAEEFGPVFQFGYVADSSHTYMRFAEMLVNRRKVMLSNWCHKRLLNYNETNDVPDAEWSPAELNARSTTRVFPIGAGDTVQFYRTLSWKDRLTGAVSFNRYVNPNPIAYSVELVNMANGNRVLLLDTANIAQASGSTKPCLYSWYPPAARVRQVVPAMVDSADAIIRINTWAYGQDPKPFYRKDKMSRLMPAFDLSHEYWSNYNDSVEANSCGQSAVCDLLAAGVAGPSGVNVSISGSTTLTSVDICDVYGTVLWSSSVPLSATPSFVPCSTGLVIIVGRTNGQATCTRKVIVP